MYYCSWHLKKRAPRAPEVTVFRGVGRKRLQNTRIGLTRKRREQQRERTEDIRMGLDRNKFRCLRTLGFAVLTCLSFLVVQNRYAFGQVDEGAISGTVQDTTGAVVPDAQVILVNKDQGITLETKTNSTGGYIFSPVRVGNYSITVTAKGFAKTTQNAVQVAVGTPITVNIQVKLGSATETVEVNTAPPLMQTEEASVGQVIDQKEVNSLPLNGRNFTFLAQLGAGKQTRAATRHRAHSPPTAFARRRITTCSMASITTPTPSTSSTEPTSSSCP